jgi:outer membrane beta-barrel protein
MRRALLTLAATGVLVAGAETRAFALQGGEDPALLPVLLDKRYGADGRQKASLMLTTSVITKLVQDTGFVATYQYSFNDLIGVGLTAGYFFGSETSIGDAIRLETDPTCQDPASPSNCEELGDLFQMQWLASADVVFVPLYGKMSFASELNPSFELYLIGGAGAGGVRRKNTQFQSTASIGHDSKVTVVANIGLGLRFHIVDWIGVRAEFRDYFFPEPASGVGGMTWVPHVQVGAEFTFGGGE